MRDYFSKFCFLTLDFHLTMENDLLYHCDCSKTPAVIFYIRYSTLSYDPVIFCTGYNTLSYDPMFFFLNFIKEIENLYFRFQCDISVPHQIPMYVR